MNKRLHWLYAIIAVGGLVLTSCSKDDPVSDGQSGQPGQNVQTAKDILAKCDRVTIIKDTIDTDGKSALYFYFTQPLDHKNPAAGNFKQYCVLHYEHPDSITVLHTQGYSITERKYFRQIDLSRIFGGNYLEVEHRYYKRSEIGDSQEDFTKTSYWDYNTAAQSTADLHDIVTTLKATKAFNGKWVSSGVSKNGILTSLYAYYYPNEVDVYVPFCAPFCTELESPGIGRYVSQQCAKGTEAREKSWKALEAYLDNPEMQEEVASLYKEEFADNQKVQKYSTKSITRLMTRRFMRSMFQKFAYHPVEEWSDVIPASTSSAKKHYLFASLGKKNFNKNLKALRKLYEIEKDEEYYDYEDDTYDEYEDNDGEEDYWDDEDPAEDAPAKVVSDKVLDMIYRIHAAKELGYFLDDWQWLLDKELITEKDVKVFNGWQSITYYIKQFGVTYDGGTLMNNFLSFVKNNRNDKKCRMLFIYGSNDPWTGAAIPDPAADDPYVKKYVVRNGVHSGHLNYDSHYTSSDKNYIISTVRTMMKSN